MNVERRTTLYEDWTFRRARLLDRSPPGHDGAAGIARAHIDVLEFLLRRYERDPAARNPARFAFDGTAHFEQRVLVVHGHLARLPHEPIVSREQADIRARKILARIAGVDPQASMQTPGGGESPYLSAGYRSAVERVMHGTAEVMADSVRAGKQTLVDMGVNMTAFLSQSSDRMLDLQIDLFRRLSNQDQHRWLTTLFRRLKHSQKAYFRSGRGGLTEMAPDKILEFFQRCGHLDAALYTHIAWRERLPAFGRDALTEQLERVLRHPPYREVVAERLREDLAHKIAPLRLGAIELLAELGNLQDIGLLSDLLALPPQDDEADGEREKMLAAMRALAEHPSTAGPPAQPTAG